MASIIHATGSSFFNVILSIQLPGFHEMQQRMMGQDAKQCKSDASHVLHKELLSEKGPPRFDPWGFQLLSASPRLRELPRSSRGHGSSRR